MGHKQILEAILLKVNTVSLSVALSIINICVVQLSVKLQLVQPVAVMLAVGNTIGHLWQKFKKKELFIEFHFVSTF